MRVFLVEVSSTTFTSDGGGLASPQAHSISPLKCTFNSCPEIKTANEGKWATYVTCGRSNLQIVAAEIRKNIPTLHMTDPVQHLKCWNLTELKKQETSEKGK